jgi:beta-lactam-binding protein with PASTA domain
MDRDTLFNWIGDPWGSAVEWMGNNLIGFSRRGTPATVPDLTGAFVAEARGLLTRARLRMKVIEPATLAVGQVVVRQHPSAGLSVRRGSIVTVYVGQRLPRPAARNPFG